MRYGFKAEETALNFVLEFSIPFLWSQDRQSDEMREEEETRESYDIKNGNRSDGSKKIGVDNSIPLPWPQDRPPDEKLLRDSMREEEEIRESYDIKNENGSEE